MFQAIIEVACLLPNIQSGSAHMQQLSVSREWMFSRKHQWIPNNGWKQIKGLNWCVVEVEQGGHKHHWAWP